MNTRIISYTFTTSSFLLLWTTMTMTTTTLSLLLAGAGNTLAVDTTKLNRMASHRRHRRELFSEPFPNANIDDFAITYQSNYDSGDYYHDEYFDDYDYDIFHQSSSSSSSSSSSDTVDYNNYYYDNENDDDDDEFIDILSDQSYVKKMRKHACVEETKNLYTTIRDEYNIDTLDVYPICTSNDVDEDELADDEWNSFLTCDYTQYQQEYESVCNLLDGHDVILDMTHYCTINTYFKTNVPFCVSKQCVDNDNDDDDMYLNNYLEENLIDLVAEEGALLDDDAVDPCPIFAELTENTFEEVVEEWEDKIQDKVVEESQEESIASVEEEEVEPIIAELSECMDAIITDIQSNPILTNFWDENVTPYLQEICNENRSICNFHSLVTQYKELCQSDQVGGVFIAMDMKCHHSYYDTISYQDMGYPMCVSTLCPLNDGYVEIMQDVAMHWMKEFECEVRLSEVTSSEEGATSLAI